MSLYNSNENVPSTIFFVAYVGSSMNPTLREPEIIEILPYGSSHFHIGDVAYFLSPEAAKPVVHRIIRVTRAGITTLGDNNTRKDAFLLQPKNINGRVVAAWRGQKRRRIAGGLQGKLTSYWLRWQHVLDRGISPLLHPLYRVLANWSLFTRVLPISFQPRIVVFNMRGRVRFQLLIGQHIIGQYDDQRHQWQISRPFRLLVNERMLPRPLEKDRLDQQGFSEWQQP